MSFGLFYKPEWKVHYHRARLNVDPDPLAERIVITDRNSMALLYNGGSDKTQFDFNVKYANSSDIMVLIMDDTREYNAKVADGVQLELVDLAVPNA